MPRLPYVIRRLVPGLLLACGVIGNATAMPITVTIENLSANGGLFLTPMWVGFHDGSFDLYNQGQAATPGLERLAEDGDTMPLSGEFAAATSASGGLDATVVATGGAPGPFDPGEIVSAVFDLDPTANQFFSYASMVIPSNDAFIANGNPTAFELFNAAGDFNGEIQILVLGAMVLDAGTELNTETDAAFLDQTAPDTGTVEGGVVALHPGFNGSAGNPGGAPVNILSGTAINGAGVLIIPGAADFTLPGFEVARITISAVAAVPEPSELSLLLLGLGLLVMRNRRKPA